MKLPGDWGVEPPDRLTRRDGRYVVELKRHAGGLRDLNAALLQLAVDMRAAPTVERALLAIHMPRATTPRIRDAWDHARAVLDSKVASRISLAVFAADGRWSDAPHKVFGEVIEAIGIELEGARDTMRRESPSLGNAFFDITKVLLEGWLRRRGPLQIQTIMRLVGCSGPTVVAALQELDARSEIGRRRDRSVELRGLPRRTLGELVVRSDRLRRTRWFVDRTGKTDPNALLKRIMRAMPDDISVGGVVAAHHYHPEFDLRGLPRIDLTAHSVRHAKFDPSVLVRIDPAIAETASPKSEPIVAVHALTRAETLFEPQAHGLPYADPVEVLLDLHEMHLGPQAEDFVAHLRKAGT